jgi:hypothetical protein
LWLGRLGSASDNPPSLSLRKFGSINEGPVEVDDDCVAGHRLAGAWQMRPVSRGYFEAKSNRPGDAPAINPRYLSEESDRRVIVGGLRLARRIFAAPALQPFVRDYGANYGNSLLIAAIARKDSVSDK